MNVRIFLLNGGKYMLKLNAEVPMTWDKKQGCEHVYTCACKSVLSEILKQQQHCTWWTISLGDHLAIWAVWGWGLWGLLFPGSWWIWPTAQSSINPINSSSVSPGPALRGSRSPQLLLELPPPAQLEVNELPHHEGLCSADPSQHSDPNQGHVKVSCGQVRALLFCPR